MWQEILKSVIVLFIIIDPFISAVFLLKYTKDLDRKESHKQIMTAILVAAILLFAFLFTGLYVMNLLGISLNGFRIAGGIILLIMGVTTVLGIELGSGGHREHAKAAAILIGTPLLAGPGALTTIIILSNDYGYLIPALATLVVLILSYIILRSADFIQRLVGSEIIEIMSKVLGLLLAALAVDFIYAGVMGFIG